MMPHGPIRDLMLRTMWNLEFINERAKPQGPYEVTQLINSFLAALAHPWEAYEEELNSLSIRDAVVDGWPELPKELLSDDDPRNLGDLLRLVRNAFAHGNLEFQSTSGGEITDICFWNTKNGTRTWGAVASVDTMRQFLDKFVALAESLSVTDAASARRRGA